MIFDLESTELCQFSANMIGDAPAIIFAADGRAVRSRGSVEKFSSHNDERFDLI